MNDKKRLETSYSNLERSRSVQDGTCSFPQNFVGCDLGAYAKDNKVIRGSDWKGQRPSAK